MNAALFRRYFRRIWKRSLGGVLAVLATALLAVAGGVVAAPARAVTQECPRGYFCFWMNDGFLPAHVMGMVNKDVPNLTAYVNPLCSSGTWNDCISSIYNNTESYVRIYDESNYNLDVGHCCEPSMEVGPGQAWGSMPLTMGLQQEVVEMKDSISSIKFWTY